MCRLFSRRKIRTDQVLIDFTEFGVNRIKAVQHNRLDCLPTELTSSVKPMVTGD